MGKFWIEDVTDCAGNRYWVLFTHGMFHEPTAVIDDRNMRSMAEKVLNVTMAELEATYHDLGTALKDYRKRTGMSQAELADRAGVSRATLSGIERGKANYTMETRRELMDAMIDGNDNDAAPGR